MSNLKIKYGKSASSIVYALLLSFTLEFKNKNVEFIQTSENKEFDLEKMHKALLEKEYKALEKANELEMKKVRPRKAYLHSINPKLKQLPIIAWLCGSQGETAKFKEEESEKVRLAVKHVFYDLNDMEVRNLLMDYDETILAAGDILTKAKVSYNEKKQPPSKELKQLKEDLSAANIKIKELEEILRKA